MSLWWRSFFELNEGSCQCSEFFRHTFNDLLEHGRAREHNNLRPELCCPRCRCSWTGKVCRVGAWIGSEQVEQKTCASLVTMVWTVQQHTAATQWWCELFGHRHIQLFCAARMSNASFVCDALSNPTCCFRFLIFPTTWLRLLECFNVLWLVVRVCAVVYVLCVVCVMCVLYRVGNLRLISLLEREDIKQKHKTWARLDPVKSKVRDNIQEISARNDPDQFQKCSIDVFGTNNLQQLNYK